MPSSEQFSGTRQSRGHWEQQTQSLPRLWWVQSPQWWDWEGRKTLSQCLCVCWVSRRFSCSLGWACFRPIRTSSPHLPPLLSCQSSAVSYGLECRQGLGPFSDSDFFFFLTKVLFFFFLSLNFVLGGEGNGTPLQYSCLENPVDGGAWWAAVHGVTTSWTRLSNFPFTFHFHALEEEMATHSRILAWRIPGTGEPGGLPSMGLHRVGHDWSDLAVAAFLGKYGLRG